VHPTGGSRRVFKLFAWLGIGSGKVALSPPAHPRVTLTVGRFTPNNNERTLLNNETYTETHYDGFIAVRLFRSDILSANSNIHTLANVNCNY
jgi:hypothetical protein